jgi:DNA-binding transcriptional LysR family regulator
MHLSNFYAFVAVMEQGSVSQAAKMLHLTQPAVTKRLQVLQEALNVQLFTPIGRSIQPTYAAKMLLPAAIKWLQDYESMKRQLSHTVEQVQGPLHIGTSHHIGLHYLSKPLQKYVQQYPQVQLQVSFVDSEAAHQAVLEGGVEMAFLTLPPQIDPKLHYTVLWEDPLVFVCAKTHPLAQLPSCSLHALALHAAILPASNTYTTQITLAAFKQQGISINATMHTNPLESIRMLVEVGLGWSVLPEPLIGEGLEVLKLADVNLHRQLGIVWHSERLRSKAADALIGQFITAANA